MKTKPSVEMDGLEVAKENDDTLYDQNFQFQVPTYTKSSHQYCDRFLALHRGRLPRSIRCRHGMYGTIRSIRKGGL
jgi:hypothetical protein